MPKLMVDRALENAILAGGAAIQGELSKEMSFELMNGPNLCTSFALLCKIHILLR